MRERQNDWSNMCLWAARCKRDCIRKREREKESEVLDGRGRKAFTFTSSSFYFVALRKTEFAFRFNRNLRIHGRCCYYFKRSIELEKQALAKTLL